MGGGDTMLMSVRAELYVGSKTSRLSAANGSSESEE